MWVALARHLIVTDEHSFDEPAMKRMKRASRSRRTEAERPQDFCCTLHRGLRLQESYGAQHAFRREPPGGRNRLIGLQ
jgi:hypothetical protein